MTHSGGQPHAVGDRGQKFEVTYFDPDTDTRKVFGWSDTAEGAQRMGNSIELHPSMQFPQVRNRRVSLLPHRECVRCDNQEDCNSKGQCFQAWVKSQFTP